MLYPFQKLTVQQKNCTQTVGYYKQESCVKIRLQKQSIHESYQKVSLVFPLQCHNPGSPQKPYSTARKSGLWREVLPPLPKRNVQEGMIKWIYGQVLVSALSKVVREVLQRFGVRLLQPRFQLAEEELWTFLHERVEHFPHLAALEDQLQSCVRVRGDRGRQQLADACEIASSLYTLFRGFLNNIKEIKILSFSTSSSFET